MADGGSVVGDGVMRQVWVEVERLYAFEPAWGASRSLPRLMSGCSCLVPPSSTVAGRNLYLIVNRHSQPLHHRPGVLAEPLLTRDQRVAVVRYIPFDAVP